MESDDFVAVGIAQIGEIHLSGIRQGAAGQMYLAYLRDPDGNKIVGLHRVPA